MQNPKKLGILLLLATLCAFTLSIALATDGEGGLIIGGDDGMMFRRNVSKTPDSETADAYIGMMEFYVPAQSSDGIVGPVEYYGGDGALIETRDYAKPLFTSYIDGVEVDGQHSPVVRVVEGGITFGTRDAFVAMSLDDGTSWKRTNLSDAAHLSSFTLANGTEYPGDTYSGVMAVAGDRVIAAWLSRYCMGGDAAYAQKDELGASIYPDYFGVAGSQKSIDYSAEYPEVGEIPFGCVWTARGQLLPGTDDAGQDIYEIVWTKAERLTSGRRDANRIEVAGVDDAGFALVWQEDPEGLRPGQGLGPGEGWSGAIVNAKTDIWYSFVGWDDFDQVCADPAADECVPVTLAEYEGLTLPKVAVPMEIPVRLTDNGKCQIGGDNIVLPPYCYMDFSGYPDVMEDIPEEQPELPLADATYCSDYVDWTTPGGAAQEICVTQDGRVLIGRVGASRPRIGLHGYDQDGDGIDDSAWVILGYEETKALGEGTADEETDAAAIDVGKNLWYQSFDMFHPDIIGHGNILNPPAIDPLTGEFYPLLHTDDDGGLTYDEYAYYFYETEIARRFSLIAQDIVDVGPSGTVAFTLVKQGIINQGGPADIFGRRFVLPAGFNPQTDNPYAFTNMVCSDWDFADGSHPYYPDGICLDPPINISGTEAVDCDGEACPTIEDVYICDDTTGECEFVLGDFTRVTEWSQTEDMMETPSWYNPFDIAKGHRGFLDGDFLMVMYAWSPNYKQNAVGHDHYNLYIRRSFDGGATWTTTPAGEPYYGDGTETCENFGWGTDEIFTVCTEYGPGVYEPARNVSQLIGSRETILDPRYTPTPSFEEEDWMYSDDERDRSRFFVVYETGDNTTVSLGEATPLNLYYSRGSEWGDTYDVVEYENNGEIVLAWDWLEHGDDESGEASLATNPAGTFFYAVWSQELSIGEEEFTDMDVWFRRVLYLDDGDAMPTASILFASHVYATFDAGDLTFIGSGRDNDHVGSGVVAYEWSSSLDGVLGAEQELVIPVTMLSAGRHTISFRVLDDEGNWSSVETAFLSVGDLPYMTCVPLITKQ
ncbi:MAG: choice-of-anchor O protein [Anaerolineae bacterium]|nr:choice-of-anchor O protein [Anaerolineae bacterium]